ncbi:hypothetical protein EJB05_02800, partial [Eragrostis curvula]
IIIAPVRSAPSHSRFGRGPPGPQLRFLATAPVASSPDACPPRSTRIVAAARRVSHPPAQESRSIPTCGQIQGIRSEILHAGSMPLSKPSHGERDDAPRTYVKADGAGQQHLYLIFDDWELGYSIRELNLSNTAAAGADLPPPFIRLEATRGCPEFFAAVGTKILATHPRDDFVGALEPGGVLPIVDVRSRGVNLAPGELYPHRPIFIPLGDDEIFALDMDTFKTLSMKPLWPPRLQYDRHHQISEWSWRNLPMPPTFQRMDVTSYAVDSDGQTILVSTADSTFAFDTSLCREWKKRGEWPLPFSGRANFVHGLDVFVGLPKDPDAFGHLCFCRLLGDDDDKHVWFSKENLSSKDPAEESHVVGTTLVYLGETRFCLVECVSNGDAKAVEKWVEEWDELHQTEDWEDCPLNTRCRLTTFSLSSDMNGDLLVADTAVQCYEVPMEASYDLAMSLCPKKFKCKLRLSKSVILQFAIDCYG